MIIHENNENSINKIVRKINEATVTQDDLSYVDDLLHYAVNELTKGMSVKLVRTQSTVNVIERIVKFPIKYIGNVTAESSPEDIANALSTFVRKKGHRILDTYVRKDLEHPYVSVETRCKGEKYEVLGNAYFVFFWDPVSVRYGDPNSIYIEASIHISDLKRNKVKLVSY